MARENLEEIIGTAIIDARFREELLRDASCAAREFDLTPEERMFVGNVRANSLQSFAQKLQDWLNGEPTTSLSASTAVVTR